MDIDQLLRRAIDEKRLVSFTLNGRRRIGEPHDYGLIAGEPRLFFYQTGGESQSGRPLGWRWARLAGMSDLGLLDDRFPGTRPAPSGKHIEWDEILASVSKRP